MIKVTTPDEIYQELFEAVQNAQLLGDSKTFVDAVPKRDPQAIVADYLARRDDENFHMLAFIAENFRLPSNGDAGTHAAEGRTVRQHIEIMWDALTRQRDVDELHSSLLPLPRPYVVPGGRFREIYYWDSYFTMLGLAAAGRTEMIEDMVANFSYLIDRVGFIPNGNRTYYCTRSQPPFFALMVELLAEARQDPLLIRNYLPQLQREYDFWMAGADTLDDNNPATRRVIRVDGAYLNRYWDDSTLPRQESYEEDVILAATGDREPEGFYRDIRAGAESGWDYSSRWFADGKHMATVHTTQVVPVDLNSLMYKLESVLAQGYELSNDQQQAQAFRDRADARKRLIQKLFFSKKAGFFADLLLPDLKPAPTLSLAAGYPLFFGLATPEQAEQVADKIDSSFLKPGGWVTTLNRTGQQWDSPNGWAPLHWIVYQGLCNYGYREQAEEGARRWIKTNLQDYESSGVLMEKYNVEHAGVLAGGGEYDVQDGFGWTNGVLLRLMDEVGAQ